MVISKTPLRTSTAAYPVVSDDGRGLPHWRAYLIARRRNLLGPTTWQLLGTLILDEAPRRYEAGTHLMVQARDGDWTLQYLIPRQISTPSHP